MISSAVTGLVAAIVARTVLPPPTEAVVTAADAEPVGSMRLSSMTERSQPPQT